MPEAVRRLLSHYGAVGGLVAGHQREHKSYDATNVPYATVWEYWKLEEVYKEFLRCRGITNVNTAGNIMEALLGIAWIFAWEKEILPFKNKITWGSFSDCEKDSVGYHGSFFFK